jgi:L-lactate dehydrogenase complex protein LldE
VSRVALFVTCVGDLVTPDVPAAAVRVLRVAGDEVEVPAGQTCCGQPAWNAGFAPEAASVAEASLVALEQALAGGADVVVVPAGSCATMIRGYWPTLFEAAGQPELVERARAVGDQVRELTEWLVEQGRLPAAGGGAASPGAVALQRSCHLERELHIRTQPRELLERAGCELAEWPADDRCCGFGGTFSVKLPEVSVAMADEKLDALPDDVVEVVGTDASCLLQLDGRARQRGLDVRFRHIAEVLAEGLDA